MSRVKKIGKVNRLKFGSVMVFLIAFLMIGSTITNVIGSDNEQNYQDEKLFNIDAGENSIDIEIPIGEYEIKTTDIGDEIFVKDYGRLLVPGKPNLPSKIFSIAIPPGAKVIDVTFETYKGVILPGTFNVPPSSLPRVIGDEDPEIYEQERKTYENNYDEIYGSNQPYPKSNGEFVRKSGYRKYNLVDVRILCLITF